MKKKWGKFYADWRDEKGVRHAKAFRSKPAARRYTLRMRRTIATKKARTPAKPSRRSPARGFATRRRTSRTGRLLKTLSPSPAT
jgi:hypothetical protein